MVDIKIKLNCSSVYQIFLECLLCAGHSAGNIAVNRQMWSLIGLQFSGRKEKYEETLESYMGRGFCSIKKSFF